MDWLAQQLLAQTQPGGDAANLAALEARCAQLKREEQQLAEQVEALTRAMSDKLEPLGLGGQVKAGLRSALDAFRSLADRARLASQTKDRQALLADSLRGMVMDESEFNQQWSELPEADQVRVMQLASTREGFETACARLPEVSRARKEAETQRESLRKAMDGVRDQLETFGRIDREAEQMQRGTEDARVRQQLVERWDKALKITSRLVDSMVNRAAQNIAPEIERALRQVLEQAPIKGLQDVRLGKNLDLEITYENAPAGLPAEELLDYLSAGALQQLALALRLALARVASGRTDLPLLLDEPLAELDDERAQLAFRYIARLAESTQIVITTCHERQYSWLVQETGMASLLRVPVKP
jgi:DNA repair exonuclease SbcCD ATPase subunit